MFTLKPGKVGRGSGLGKTGCGNTGGRGGRGRICTPFWSPGNAGSVGLTLMVPAFGLNSDPIKSSRLLPACWPCTIKVAVRPRKMITNRFITNIEGKNQTNNQITKQIEMCRKNANICVYFTLQLTRHDYIRNLIERGDFAH